MLTEDENIVEVPISVQYTIPDPKKFILQVRDPITSLHHATDSAIRHVVGGTKSSDVLSQGRQAMAEETKVRLQSYLDSYDTGINITLVNILKAEPPKAVKPAFDDVISAKEDKDRYVNEAKTYANGLVPEARGKAERIMQEAIGYREKLIAEADGEAQRFVKLYNEYRKAPEVTRERLYLDSVEGVMSNVSKVLIDVEGGNNMMYLPLDKMVSQPKSALPEATASGQNDIVSQVANQVIDRIRQEQSRARRSEALIMSNRYPIIVLILALILLLASSIFYRVLEVETAVKLRFGELVSANIEPGLHAKIPFADVIRKVDRRLLTLDARPESFYTVEKKRLEVDSFVKWRVVDVEKYYLATNGDEERAKVLLANRVNNDLRDEIGLRTLHEVVSGERDQMMATLTDRLHQAAMADFGVEVIDVRVKRIDFPQEVSNDVYNRMRADREKEARQYRSEGLELAEKFEPMLIVKRW